MLYNDEQLRVIEHVNGPLLCVAGPGSGKTSSIIAKVNNMVKSGIPPQNILVVTFTKNAAEEMKNRFAAMTDSPCSVTFCTIHSFCFRVLNLYNPTKYTLDNILKEYEIRGLLKEAAMDTRTEIGDINTFINSIIAGMTDVKNNELNIEKYSPEYCTSEEFVSIVKRYEMYKEKYKKYDFDDMLIDCRNLLLKSPNILEYWRNKYSHFVIDEFQDTNFVQCEILYALSAPLNNITVVGDDDQSIYKFRGAKPEIMLDFEKRYPDCQKVTLGLNYRSEPEIVSLSSRLISANSKRFKKNLEASKRGEGIVEYLFAADREDEARLIVDDIKAFLENGDNLNDFAILYRTNIQAIFLTKKLTEEKIPFKVSDIPVNIYDHWIFKDIMTYYKLASGKGDIDDFKTILNHPNRYIPRSLFDNIQFNKHEVFSAVQSISDKWKRDNAERQMDDLFMVLNYTKNKSPYEFINVVRDSLEYDKYLEEYAAYRQEDAEDLFDVLSQIQSEAFKFKTFVEWARHIKEYKSQIDFIVANSRDVEAITLSTMHQAKGLEWNCVYIIDANQGICPHKKAKSKNDIEEERRLFYVACTRAKSILKIYSIKARNGKLSSPSQFIRETGLDRTKGTILKPDFDEKAINFNISIGDWIVHKSFGRGIVRKVNGDNIEIIFNAYGLKTLSLETCKKNKLLNKSPKN